MRRPLSTVQIVGGLVILIAAAFAMGGALLPGRMVTGADVTDGSITGADVKHASIRAGDLDPSLADQRSTVSVGHARDRWHSRRAHDVKLTARPYVDAKVGDRILVRAELDARPPVGASRAQLAATEGARIDCWLGRTGANATGSGAVHGGVAHVSATMIFDVKAAGAQTVENWCTPPSNGGPDPFVDVDYTIVLQRVARGGGDDLR
jgi:hypothetical protein